MDTSNDGSGDANGDDGTKTTTAKNTLQITKGKPGLGLGPCLLEGRGEGVHRKARLDLLIHHVLHLRNLATWHKKI